MSNIFINTRKYRMWNGEEEKENNRRVINIKKLLQMTDFFNT